MLVECGTNLIVPMHGSLLHSLTCYAIIVIMWPDLVLSIWPDGLPPLNCNREVLNYYSGDENAYDMRKAMPRDVRKTSVIPLKRPVRPEELEFD